VKFGYKALFGEGKDHAQYEYGNKVSVVSTAKSNIIVSVVRL